MRKTLLIVDDAMIIREMIKDAVEPESWEIVGEAANGQEAIIKYQTLRPDAVTLDLVMPRFDGLHALRGIREFDPLARVLIVSAINQKEKLTEALRYGAGDFIVKPFEALRLRTALTKIVARMDSMPVILPAASSPQ
ncbi:response regulator [Lignipirellula cremea]|uniref:Chemotaxis protein CheY n=1 Tax=Lignipirellula cremea TaxID=2528010 RepID=A0A518DUC6_9BACT|nr:response regulator [Lignipirellula cremea]QDU95428.1 Chemotaxis protein CheY [Lignipirellula cremea]